MRTPRDTSSFETFIIAESIDSLSLFAFQCALLAFLFCMLLFVFVAAVRALIREELKQTSRKVMLAIIIIMFVSTVITVAYILGDLSIGFVSVQNSVNAIGEEQGEEVILKDSVFDLALAGYGAVVPFSINVVLGDIILAWRAHVIWRGRKLVSIVSALLILATLAVWILASVGGIVSFFPPIPSFAVSLWCTGVIGVKTWIHRRMLKQDIIVLRRSSVEHILAILTESGVAYNILWALLVITGFLSPNVFSWISIIMVAFVPMYPMLIVLFVAQRKTPLSDSLGEIDPITVINHARVNSDEIEIIVLSNTESRSLRSKDVEEDRLDV